MDVQDSVGPDHTGGTRGGHEPPGPAEGGTTGDRDSYDEGAGMDPSEGSGAAEPPGIGTGSSAGTMIVEVDGEIRRLPAEKDYTGDGQADAVIETADGHVIVFADTENNTTGEPGPDGRADEAYVVDKQTGRVVGAAHLDPGSGTWVEGTGSDGPGPADGRADVAPDPGGDRDAEPAAVDPAGDGRSSAPTGPGGASS